MRKMFFFVLTAAALLFMVPTQNAQAQSRSETPKVEVGVQYTLLRFTDADQTDSGVGGRVTLNLSDNFGLETEVNFFPQERVNFANLSSLNSRRMQGLFGAKYGIRSQKFGIFGKVRPGFIRFSEGSSPIGDDPSLKRMKPGLTLPKMPNFWDRIPYLAPNRPCILRLFREDKFAKLTRS